jgi:hypothetical protein
LTCAVGGETPNTSQRITRGEVQAFSAGELLGVVPPVRNGGPCATVPGECPLDPVFEPDRLFEISGGRLEARLAFYGPHDGRAGGRSIHKLLRWRWERNRFVRER